MKYSGEFVGLRTVFWMGVVEDRNDPIKLGRVRVRIYGWYTDEKQRVPTESLPWAQVIQQPNTAAMGDIGYTPTGIVEGTWVVGIFLDGDKGQQPVIMGTLAGIPTEAVDATKGFNDPNGVYPSRLNEPDVNRLARNDTDFVHPNPSTKDEGRSTDVATSTASTWSEPGSAYSAQYPYNHVYESESGHIREYDDTAGNERIHEYHKAGTFYEIDKDGNKVTRIVANNYTIVAGDDYAYVKGSVNLTIDGDCNTYIKGDWNVKVDGDVDETIGGNQTTAITGNLDIDAARIDLN